MAREERPSSTTALEVSAEVIQCRPRGLCSWTYDLHGETHDSALEVFETFGEGVLELDGERLEVRFEGRASARWSISRGGTEIVSAQRQSEVVGKFRVEGTRGPIVLSPAGQFSSTFLAEREYRTVARIAPEHPFTRRAVMWFAREELEDLEVTFLFWLVASSWRRSRD